MRPVALVLAAAVFTSSTSGQTDPETPKTVDFAGSTWRVQAREVRTESYLGRDSLVLKNGEIWNDALTFGDGVIEFDIAYEEAQSFIGLMWRAESDDRFEDIYVRAHLNAKPDALQYTPTENGLAAWQIFSDGNSQTAANQRFGAWNHVKLVAVGDSADIYFNSDEPVMHVPDLKTDIASGRIGLRSFSLAGKETYFSNLSVRPLNPGEKLTGSPVEMTPPPEGLIEKWTVSSPFAESVVADALSLDDGAFNGLEWKTLPVETNGVANLARLSGVSENADTVFVRLNVKADKAQMKELRFGYSDRVRIYLNGKRVYYGEAGWRVRDYRFLGTVGFFDSAGLDLKKGDNELLVAVSETFGGWAWAGTLEDRNGVTIATP